MRHLKGDDPAMDDDSRRRELYPLLAGADNADWYRRQIDALPDAYLQSAPGPQLALELRHLAALRAGEVKTWCRYLPESRTVEYTIGTHESVTAGIFHKLTGGLSSQGLEILSADIYTLLDGLVLDRFVVTDPDFAQEPPQERLNQVHEALNSALVSESPPIFRRVWRSKANSTLETLSRRPTQIRADNNTSEKYTILDVFATDRVGLLYTISRTLFQLGLSVSLAKIATFVDQVIDVFYVSDQLGNKIEDENRLREIQQHVLRAVTELEQAGQQAEQVA
jgi:[protein-PII] uridylyltransferase